MPAGDEERTIPSGSLHKHQFASLLFLFPCGQKAVWTIGTYLEVSKLTYKSSSAAPQQRARLFGNHRNSLTNQTSRHTTCPDRSFRFCFHFEKTHLAPTHSAPLFVNAAMKDALTSEDASLHSTHTCSKGKCCLRSKCFLFSKCFLCCCAQLPPKGFLHHCRSPAAPYYSSKFNLMLFYSRISLPGVPKLKLEGADGSTSHQECHRQEAALSHSFPCNPVVSVPVT